MDDVFYVVGISEQERRASDPVRRFIAAAVEHGESLVQKGLGPPDAVAIPVEIYSLSLEHKEHFADYGAVGNGYDLLYFLSESVVRMAQRLGVDLPPALKEIPRSALPPERGSRIRLGEHFWDHRVDA